MAEPAPAAAAPSAPPATPVAPADGSTPPPAAPATEKVAVTPEAASAQIESTEDYAALEAALDEANAPKVDPPAAVAKEATPTPAPAAPAATPPDASAAPAAPATAAAEPGSDDEVIDEPTGEKLPKNFRFHTDDPALSRYLQLLRREPGSNPIELALRAGYTLPSTTATPAAPAAAQSPTSEEAIESALKPLRDEIAALLEQKKAKRAVFEFGEADDIGDQIIEKRLALERTRSELETQAAYDAEYTAEYGTARAESVAKYPDTAVKGTPQYEALVRERAYLEATEPGFFDQPDYPSELITRLEKSRPDLFKAATPAAAPAAPAAVTPPPAVAPKLPARPVGEVAAGNETATQPLSKEATEKAINEMTDPDEIARLADMVGTQIKGGRVVQKR